MGTSSGMDAKTVVQDDGLRYASKTSGSPYFAAGTMSCLLCARHVAKAALQVFEVAGARQYRCRDRADCKQARDEARGRT